MDKKKLFTIAVSVTIIATIFVAALLVTIFERKQEAQRRFVERVEVKELEPDPEVWKMNFPVQYDLWQKTSEDYGKTKYGGSEQRDHLANNPRLKKLFEGNPFSIDYKEDRGHFHSLTDVIATKRLGANKPGTCMACKSSDVPKLMKEMGVAEFYKTPFNELTKKTHHPISCADCHDSKTMELTITRPAFKEAMERRGIDLKKATRQEMRSYTCAQCHVEYYFKGEGKQLTFPWDKGLKIEEIEQHYDEYQFKDWVHPVSGAPLVKMQHPEFELWSTGIHAKSGVSCADCHMPYKRVGAQKVSDHWVRSPLANIAASCQTCHRWDENELKARVHTIQDRTAKLLERTEVAILAAIDAIDKSKKSGATDTELEKARQYHRKAQIRWDFISAENSMGFHSPQETARILAEAIDYARQSEIAALTVKKIVKK